MYRVLCGNFSCALSLYRLPTSQHFIYYAFCNTNNVTVYLITPLEARANEICSLIILFW